MGLNVKWLAVAATANVECVCGVQGSFSPEVNYPKCIQKLLHIFKGASLYVLFCSGFAHPHEYSTEDVHTPPQVLQTGHNWKKTRQPGWGCCNTLLVVRATLTRRRLVDYFCFVLLYCHTFDLHPLDWSIHAKYIYLFFFFFFLLWLGYVRTLHLPNRCLNLLLIRVVYISHPHLCHDPLTASFITLKEEENSFPTEGNV